METLCPIFLNSVVEADRLRLQATSTAQQFDIIDTRSGNSLGRVSQQPGSQHQVELFLGKGGFMGMITSPLGARYFALPGSEIQVGGVSLSLPGSPIVSNPQKQVKTRQSKNAKPPQTHIHQATILGAGLATRFERISGDSTQYSKPAVPLVGNHSVIECIANQLTAHGFDQIIVNTYFKPESLKASLKRSQVRQVSYIDENQPSGTAGGLRKMLLDPTYANLLDLNRPLLVVQGDAVTDADFSALMEAHVAHNALITIGCQEVAPKDVNSFGIIVTDRSGSDGQSGLITGFQEKPAPEAAKSRLGNTGFYIFSPNAYPLVREIYLDLLAKARQEARATGQAEPNEVPFDFAMNLFPEILRRTQCDPSLGPFWAQSIEGYWSDIGNPSQYLESLHDIYAGKVAFPLPEQRERYYRNGIVYWEGAAEIAEREGAVLSGNVVVALPFKP